ncbi:hypothetical protein FB567DRAFT_628844 [Paraphoma chrysanthemicola]|uniref:Uncharacterized protein n=1 Tax=Paraphoma chrysanthemicola TaxID=798071 RepID=A0A8K0R4Q3_9PLEO|nr:hypothetical protein FB567DRAFT_628844 [Paraphoma chrysanthemicola]
MESPDAWIPSELTKAPLSLITERNNRESPLLRLPGEIRNVIYRFVLEEKTESIFSRMLHFFLRQSNPDLDLSFACRCIHDEFRMLPFTLMIWKASLPEDFYTLKRMRLQPFQRRAIKHLEVKVFQDTLAQDIDRLERQGLRLSDILPGVTIVSVIVLAERFRLPGYPLFYLHMRQTATSDQNLKRLTTWILGETDKKIRFNFIG